MPTPEEVFKIRGPGYTPYHKPGSSPTPEPPKGGTGVSPDPDWRFMDEYEAMCSQIRIQDEADIRARLKRAIKQGAKKLCPKRDELDNGVSRVTAFEVERVMYASLKKEGFPVG